MTLLFVKRHDLTSAFLFLTFAISKFGCQQLPPIVLRNASLRLTPKSPMPTLIEPNLSNSYKKRITLPAILDYGGFIYPMGPIVSEAIRLAVNVIQSLNILKDYELAVEPWDNMCDKSRSVKQCLSIMRTNDEVTNRIPLLVGPDYCEQAYTGRIIKHYNFIGISSASTTLDIYTQSQPYNAYFMLQPSPELLYDGLPQFIKSNGWKRVFLLTETNPLYEKLDVTLQNSLKDTNVRLVATSKIFYITGSYPSSDSIQAAIKELMAFDPRIIVISTGYGVQVACWLHSMGLYGPNYMHLVFGYGAYLPDTPGKYSWCTERMLFETIQSSLFVNHGALLNADNRSVDSLGVPWSYIVETLDNSYDPATVNSFIYGCCRAMLYEMVVASALALNHTETELQKRNQTLSDWVTSGQRFQDNGSMFQALMRDSASNVQYSGFTADVNGSMSARKGVAAFYQYQVIRQPSPNQVSGYAQLLRATIVATYDTRINKNYSQVENRTEIVWQTPNGRPPFDSLQIVPIETPLIDISTEIGLLSTAASLILVDIVFLFVQFKKRIITADCYPKINALVLVGNCLMLIAAMLCPFQGASDNGTAMQCMIRYLILLFGFALSFTALYAKMEMANLLTTNDRKLRHFARRWAFKGPIRFAFFVTALMVVWFADAPIELIRIEGMLVYSLKDLSTAHQPFTYACMLGRPANVTKGFVAGFTGIFGMLYIRTIFLTILLRKQVTTTGTVVVADLQSVRFAAYGNILITVAGGVVVWAFFVGNANFLETAVSTVVILISTTNVVTLCISKLRPGMYLPARQAALSTTTGLNYIYRSRPKATSSSAKASDRTF